MSDDYPFHLFVWDIKWGEVSSTALHSVLSTVTQNILLSLGYYPNPALIARRLIYHQLFYQSFTSAFSSSFSRSLFLCHRPCCPPYFFNACFVHPSLPLPLSLSLHFSRTQLDMWMNTWNGP